MQTVRGCISDASHPVLYIHYWRGFWWNSDGRPVYSSYLELGSFAVLECTPSDVVCFVCIHVQTCHTHFLSIKQDFYCVECIIVRLVCTHNNYIESYFHASLQLSLSPFFHLYISFPFPSFTLFASIKANWAPGAHSGNTRFPQEYAPPPHCCHAPFPRRSNEFWNRSGEWCHQEKEEWQTDSCREGIYIQMW